MRLRHLGTFLLLLLSLGVALAACGDDDDGDGGDLALELESCGELEYEGEGEPDALIVSDLPMQGDSAERSAQQVEAIRLALEQRAWQAGDTAVGFQACDDSTAETGLWDAETCRSNAEAYAANDQVLGVVGTYNSGCAAEMIPVLNEAPVAMVSPGNTAVCLTEPSRTCEEYDPDSLYPTGERNYLRVVPNDAFQGAALAEFAARQGVESPFVLYAVDDPTSSGQAASFRGAAEEQGIELAGFESWDPEASDYTQLLEEVRRSGADAVVLAGLIEQNGGRLIRDKVEVVGSNEELPLIAFDGFTQQATIDEAGAPARGMFASVPGRAPEALSGAGRRFVSELEGRIEQPPVELYAPYAGEAAEVLLDAVTRAGGDRQGVIDALFDVERRGGILGSYQFGPSGDPTVGPVTIFRAGDTFERQQEIVPAAGAVSAAR